MHLMSSLRYRLLAFVIIGFGQKYPKGDLEGRVQSSVCGLRLWKEELRGMCFNCTLASTPKVKAVGMTEDGERLLPKEARRRGERVTYIEYP